MKKVLLALLFISLSIVSLSLHATNDSSNPQIEAIEQYWKIEEVVFSNRNIEPFYAGSYIDTENNLVVLYSDKVLKTYLLDKVQSDVIEYQYAKYTLRELELTKDFVIKSISHMIDANIEVTSVYLDIENNEVIVGIKDLSSHDTNALYSAMFRQKESNKFSMIKFEDGVYEQPTSVDSDAGAKYKNTDQMVYGSIAFSAVRNGVDGYVISGHAGSLYDNIQIKNSSGTWENSGTVTDYQMSGHVDASFVASTSNVYESNDVINGYQLTSVNTSNLPQGTQVCTYGSETNLTCSTIEDFSALAIVKYDPDDDSSKVYYTDMIKINHLVDEGDSGGILMMHMIYNQYKIVGNIVSHGSQTSTCSKYSNIANDLSISAITS